MMTRSNTLPKILAAFFTGTFLTVALMAFSQNSPQPTPPSPAPAQWMVESVDMGDYTKNPNTRGGADPGGWAPGGEGQYKIAMSKMVSEGWEPFAASVYSKDRPNTYVTFFRKSK